MPHDKNGNELQVGDLVTLTLEVRAVHMTEDACNIDALAVSPSRGIYAPLVSCNSSLFLKVSKTD